MALTPTVLFDAMLILNGSTVSDHVAKIELNVQVAEQKTTTFGQTYETLVGGLKSGTLNITFDDDFTAAQLDSILWPLLGTVVTFEVRPTSGARSATNPAYTGSVLIKELKPISGSVGDLANQDVSFPTSGTVLRQTS